MAKLKKKKAAPAKKKKAAKKKATVKKGKPKPKPAAAAPTPEKKPRKKKDLADRPAGAPPASEVMQEYETTTHRIYKLKDHSKVCIPK